MQNEALISFPLRIVLHLGITVMTYGSYCYLNANPPFTPHLLPMTPIDDAIPFMLWTVWPYASLNFGSFVLPFFIKRRDTFVQMAVGLACVMIVHVAFWSLWPTTYPRPPAPEGPTLSHQFYLLLVSVDTPVNCFPSAHVAAPSIVVYFLCRERPRFSPYLWGILGVLSLSIMTTKQHYLWDLIGAIFAVLIALRMCRWWVERRDTKRRTKPP